MFECYVEVVERNLIGFIFADGVRPCDFQVVVAVWMVDPRYILEATQPNVELGLYLYILEEQDKFTSWQMLACPVD